MFERGSEQNSRYDWKRIQYRRGKYGRSMDGLEIMTTRLVLGIMRMINFNTRNTFSTFPQKRGIISQNTAKYF